MNKFKEKKKTFTKKIKIGKNPIQLLILESHFC